MDHAPGTPRRVTVGPWGATASQHSPLRRYYINRNKVILFREYWKSEPAWTRHHILRLAVQDVLAITVERERGRKALAIVFGLYHGALAREGPAPAPVIRALRREAPA
jgi:rhamnosyltransferase